MCYPWRRIQVMDVASARRTTLVALFFPPSQYRGELLAALSAQPGIRAVAVEPGAHPTLEEPPVLVAAEAALLGAVPAAWRMGAPRFRLVAVCRSPTDEATARALAAGAGLVLARSAPSLLAQMLASEACALAPFAPPGAGLRIDQSEGRVWDGDRLLPLSPTEFLLLRVLVDHAPFPLSRQQIQTEMYGASGIIQKDSVNFTVCALRKKLGDRWSCVRTVWRKGYAWNPEPADRPQRPGGRRLALFAVLAAVGLFSFHLLRDADPSHCASGGDQDSSDSRFGGADSIAYAAGPALPGREPPFAIDGDETTWFESASPAVGGWHWLRVDWATNRSGRVSVLLGRPDDRPPYAPVFVEVSSDGRAWHPTASADAATNIVSFETQGPIRALRVRPSADAEQPFAVREITVAP